MSLAISLQQIQRPSFWNQLSDQNRVPSTNRKRLKANNERRADLLKALKANGGSLGIQALCDEFGWKRMTVRNLCATLVNDGLISRRFDSDGHVVYEVI